MGIFNNLFGRLTQKNVPYSYFYNTGIMSSIVTKRDALDFYKSWVYACVAKRSQGLAQIDFKVYKKQGDKVVEVLDHPVLDLLYRVNSQMTKFDFLQLSIIYRDLLGSSPWVLEKEDGSDVPTSMFVARPEFFTVQRGKDGAVESYTYTIGTFKKTYSPDEVIFLKNYNPKNPDKGIGIIEAVRMTAQNDDMVIQTNNKLLENGAIPSGYLETEEVVDKSEIKRLTKKARAKWQGVENAHKIQILQGGMKFKPNMLPPRDLEFIEGRKFNRDEIAAVFGVPKSLLTFDDVNRASAVAGEYQFNKWTLEPLAIQVIEQLNEFLVPMFDTDAWLGFEPLAQADEVIETAKKTASWNKWQTTNEVRESEGLGAIDGGDSIYMPFSMMPVVGGEKKDACGHDHGNVLKIGSARKMDGRVSLKQERYIIKRINARNYKTNQLIRKATAHAIKSFEGNRDVVLKIVDSKKKA